MRLKSNCLNCQALVKDGLRSFCMLAYKLKVDIIDIHDANNQHSWVMLDVKPLEPCPKPRNYLDINWYRKQIIKKCD